LDKHQSPRYPSYVLSKPESTEELKPVAASAVSRSGGRGALGPIQSGAKVLIVVTDDQNQTVLQLISDAMLEAGAASVKTLTWSQLGLPTGDFSAAEGWRELSDEHVNTVIQNGERVEQDALLKYLAVNPDFTTIYAGDAGEGHYKMALGARFKANWMYRGYEDLVARYNNYPAPLQRLIERKLIALFGKAAAVRITDPEGTDLSWDVTEEEATLWERGAWIPWHIIGSTIEGIRFAQVRPAFGGKPDGSLKDFAPHAARHFPSINGVISGTVNHTGFYPHIRLRLEGGKITSIEGGGEYGDRFRAIVDRFKDVRYPGYPSPGYHFINDATIGSNPKTFRSVEGLWHTALPWVGLGPERYRAGVIHFGFGAEHEDPEFVKFGRENQAPVKHMAHIHSYFPNYDIKDRATGEWIPVIDKGWLTLLDDPEVRRLGSTLGNPDDLLSYDWIPAMPGINHPGDYQKDYASDPVAWIQRDTSGEFGEAVR
jgi:hypothetical protein